MTRSLVRQLSILLGIALGVAMPRHARAQVPAAPAGPGEVARVAPAFTASGSTFFALSVADLAATSRWYQEKLGLRPLLQLPKRGADEGVVLGGAGLLVELIARAGSRPLRAVDAAITHDLDVHGFFKVGFFVDDLDAALATLRARGVEIAFGPFPARAEQPANVGFRDREGNLIQVFGR